jgi:hypothetical protein
VCLYVNKHRTADYKNRNSPITVYKRVKATVTFNDNGSISRKIVTPYRLWPLALKDREIKDRSRRSFKYLPVTIGRGAIHAYTDINIARATKKITEVVIRIRVQPEDIVAAGSTSVICFKKGTIFKEDYDMLREFIDFKGCEE